MTELDQKTKVLNQFKKLKEKLDSKNFNVFTELDFVVDATVDLAITHVPQLTTTIESLKELAEKKSFSPVDIAWKMNKINLYLNHIIDYLETNYQINTPQQKLSSKKPFSNISENWLIFLAGAALSIILYLLSR